MSFNDFKNPYKYEDILLVWLLLGIVFTLPWIFCFVLLGFVGTYSWLPVSWRANHKYIIATGLVIGFIVAIASVSQLFSGDSILAGVVLVAVLKRAELSSVRDRLVFIVAVFLSNSLNLIYWNNVPALLHLLVLVGLTLGFIYRNSTLHVSDDRSSNVQIMVFSVPLAIMLFLFLPRIPGPLWDVGLAFGLPISVYQQNVSLSTVKSVSKNDPLAKLKAQQRVVLVAEFSGAVPLKSKLYWRGAVSYRYKNGDWVDSLAGKKRSQRLSAAYKNIKHYQKLIISQEAPVNFKVKVAPHGEHWLYAPDLPLRNVQESYISKDGQLLTIRSLHDEFSYQGSSYLSASFHPENPPEIDESELPKNEGEQIKRLADQWKVIMEQKEIKQGLLDFLASPPAWFDAKAPFTEDRLQRWVGVSMLMLQRAGVPARMISGYRGGDLIALSDVMVVREKHRHHWLELWNESEGWSRVDVRDILQVKQTAKELKSEPNRALNTPKKLSHNSEKHSKKLAANELKKDGFLWIKKMEEWLQSYKPQIVSDLSSGSNNKRHSSFAYYFGLPILIILWLALVLFYRHLGQRKAPIEKGWHQLNRQLRRHGYTLTASQCPTFLLKQLEQRNPPWKEAAANLIKAYLVYCYADKAMSMTDKAYLTRVKRLTQALKNMPVDELIKDKPNPSESLS